MKDAVIAKVAAQAADFYKSALSSAQIQSVKQMLEKVISCDNNFCDLFVSCFVMAFCFFAGGGRGGVGITSHIICVGMCCCKLVWIATIMV